MPSPSAARIHCLTPPPQRMGGAISSPQPVDRDHPHQRRLPEPVHVLQDEARAGQPQQLARRGDLPAGAAGRADRGPPDPCGSVGGGGGGDLGPQQTKMRQTKKKQTWTALAAGGGGGRGGDPHDIGGHRGLGGRFMPGFQFRVALRSICDGAWFVVTLSDESSLA